MVFVVLLVIWGRVLVIIWIWFRMGFSFVCLVLRCVMFVEMSEWVVLFCVGCRVCNVLVIVKILMIFCSIVFVKGGSCFSVVIIMVVSDSDMLIIMFCSVMWCVWCVMWIVLMS